MATPDLIQQQVQLERDAINAGVTKLHKNTRDLEAKAYASATIYGVASIDALLPLIVEHLEQTRSRITKGQAGKNFKAIQQYLFDIENLVAAGISLKIFFDKVFSKKDKDSMLLSVATAIANGLEDECKLRYYQSEAPGLFYTLKENYWHKSCGTKQRVTSLVTLMNRAGVTPWKSWSSKQKVLLGSWLCETIMETSGWFIHVKKKSGSHAVPYVVPSDALIAIKDDIMRQSELFAPVAYPMLIPPNNWTHENAGGYLLNEVMRGHDLIRRGANHPLIRGKVPFDFLNQIQQTAWRVNPFTYHAAQRLMHHGISVGKFIPRWTEPEPVKPVDIGEDEVKRKEYRREKAQWYNRLNDNASKCVRTLKTMETAKMFEDRDFYLPWSFDYRGRAYPIPAFLTPQGTDFEKSLLTFSEDIFVDDYAAEWLAFHVATTYGLDKSPMEDRLKWVEDNLTLIKKVATDPLGYLFHWEVADEPWQFLAACDEYYRCCIACTSQTTRLPVAVDATCSGLQILAGLAKDASTARLVNVLGSERPQDAYRAVADACRPNCPERLRDYIDRKVTKRVVMTIPYNAQLISNRQYIKEALKEKGVDLTNEELTETTKAVRAAVYEIFPGPMQVMDWISAKVKEAFDNGATELTWVTPSGFPVTQAKWKYESERVETMVMGRVRMSIATETDEPNVSQHRSSCAPNLIHSLDSTLLQLTMTKFNAPVGFIHDCIMCRASDVSIMNDIIRRVYMSLFARESYLVDWAKQIGVEPDPPIIGDLQPESVLSSTYFFC